MEIFLGKVIALDKLAPSVRHGSDSMKPSWPNAITRRRFLKHSSLLTAGLAWGTTATPAPVRAAARSTLGFAAAGLPAGTAPQPVPLPHFPDRLHAFVWRNWPLMPAERMARVTGAHAGDIVSLGRAMGLDGPPRITRDQQARSFLTVYLTNS